MIDITRKEDCVGCNACVQVCPKTCISFNPDEQGFSYPKVDIEQCINCGLCEKVCPVINQDKPRMPYETYAAVNPNNIVHQDSSSGGVFHALAEKTIKDGGIVFGARFDSNWNVVHDYTDSIEVIRKFQKSKYVQSSIGETYRQVQEYLKSGKKVIFSGTPCQIAGLRRFLRKDYGELLISVDTACHGVPSPLIWQSYLKTVSEEGHFSSEDIKIIDFRDKKNGWENYGMKIVFQNNTSKKEYFSPMKNNVYMQGFLKDLYLRPSCYECPAKCGKSHSDLTLADFWGIRNNYPELYSEKGVSLVLVNTKNGEKLLSSLPLILNKVMYATALTGNPALENSAKKPKVYDSFWIQFETDGVPAITQYILALKPPIFKRTYQRLKQIAGKVRKILWK